MSKHHPPVPKAPLPTREIFDPFNSSSTGHQRAESRLAGSTSWRDSRTYKLTNQFRDASGHGGSRHLSDLIGAGAINFRKDGRKSNLDWEKGAPGLRESGWQDIRGLMAGNRKRGSEEISDKDAAEKRRRVDDRHRERAVAGTSTRVISTTPATDPIRKKPPDTRTIETSAPPPPPPPPPLIDSTVPPPQIFRGLTMYLNGSTAPLVSDHRLKQLFVQHGGNSSLALGRRTVSHVVLGKTCGGGLASGKLNKEVTTVGGKGIRYVTAQWVLDSVEKGIRQPEGQYVPSDIAGRIGGFGQRSVRPLFVSKPLKPEKG